MKNGDFIQEWINFAPYVMKKVYGSYMVPVLCPRCNEAKPSKYEENDTYTNFKW